MPGMTSLADGHETQVQQHPLIEWHITGLDGGIGDDYLITYILYIRNQEDILKQT